MHGFRRNAMVIILVTCLKETWKAKFQNKPELKGHVLFTSSRYPLWALFDKLKWVEWEGISNVFVRVFSGVNSKQDNIGIKVLEETIFNKGQGHLSIYNHL